jgi:hypothetical protein
VQNPAATRGVAMREIFGLNGGKVKVDGLALSVEFPDGTKSGSISTAELTIAVEGKRFLTSNVLSVTYPSRYIVRLYDGDHLIDFDRDSLLHGLYPVSTT